MVKAATFHNILIIKPGAIGDLLQLTPVIRSLKLTYPGAGISLLVGSRLTAELFSHNVHVHETIVYDKQGKHKAVRSLFALRKYLRQQRYDLIINFQRSNFKTWFLASAAFPCRVLVYHKARNRNVHAIVNYLETLAPLGIHTNDTRMELTPGLEDREYAETVIRRLQGAGPLIALNPGASHAVNRWPWTRFSELADLLSQELSARVLLIGGPEDVQLASQIAERAAFKPVNLAGKARLLQLAALLERTDMLVTGDTGPLHVASAMGTRIIALFGAADPERTGPTGTGYRVLQSDAPCVPCRSRTCRNETYLTCMESISAERVFAAIKELLRPRISV